MLKTGTMIYLVAALTFSTLIFLSFKLFERLNINILPAITVNYLAAIILGLLVSKKSVSFDGMIHAEWFWLSVILGFSFILVFLIFGISTQKVGVAMTVVSSKMSIVIPVAFGFVLFSEPFNWIKLAGVLAALAALVFTNLHKENKTLDKRFLLLPFLIFLGNGANDTLMKYSGIRYPQRDEFQFLIVVFGVSFLVGLFIFLSTLFRRKLSFGKLDIPAGILLGVLNWLSTLFFLRGLYHFPVTFFVPVFNASLVTLAAIAGYLLFREKLSRINLLGIGLAILSVIVIALA